MPFALAMGWVSGLGGFESVGETPAPEPANVGLEVRITEDGFLVRGEAGAVRQGVLLACSPLDCPNAAAYDVEGLARLLRQVKDEVPEENAVTLLPDDRIPYDVLLQTVSAVRDDGSPLFPWVTITPARKPES